MKTQYEVKILDIDISIIRKKLLNLGAEKKTKDIQKRYVYDFNPPIDGKWVRLRSRAGSTTLTVKEIVDDSITGTKEVEVVVDDFNKTNLLLRELGYVPKAYQENKRESYILDGVEVEIDEWPLIPPYIEIEGKSEREVMGIVKKLGFSIEDTTSINTTKVYELYGIDIHSIDELKF